jgi:hypothetical protein
MKKYSLWALLVGILSLLFGCGSESNYYKKGGKCITRARRSTARPSP